MPIILHSQQRQNITAQRDTKLIKALSGKKLPRIGFIPAAPDKRRKAFSEAAHYYDSCGFTELHFIDLEEHQEKNASDAQLDLLFKLDVIHLGSGQALPFLTRLRSDPSDRYIQRLIAFVQKGGLLIGESAGAMLMGPSLHAASFFGERAIQDARGLAMVPYEILPHWNDMRVSASQVQDFVRKFKTRILALNDGDIVVVNGKKSQFLNPLGQEITPLFFECPAMPSIKKEDP